MNGFRYKAMDAAGRIRQGRLPAATLDELEERVARMGLDLISCRPIGPGHLSPYRVTRRDLIEFCFQLEQLTGAGVGLLQALDDLRQGIGNPRFREVVSAVLDSIEEGQTLSAALERFPRVFDPVFTNLVRVGEQSGELPAILNALSDDLKWQDELVASAKKALIYPLFVAVVVFGAVAFLMVYLVPQLVQFITDLEGELPLHTRALLATSAVVTDHWGAMLGLPLAAGGAVALAARGSPAVRLYLDRTRLRLWLVGEIAQKVALARFARVFALMYRSGVPVLETLEVVGRTTGNAAIEQALVEARRRIGEGDGIGASFAASGLFLPLVLRMISVGESTGALDRALLNVAYFYDRDVRARIARLEAAIEPALTVTLGAVLAWIMLAVLGPIYDLIATIAP